MGYETSFNLSLIGDDEDIKAFEKDLIQYTTDDDGEKDKNIIELLDSGYTDGKLYVLENQVETVARRHPKVLVILGGCGEDQDDIWEVRVKGTDYEKEYAVIPPFQNKNLLLPKELEQLNK